MQTMWSSAGKSRTSGFICPPDRPFTIKLATLSARLFARRWPLYVCTSLVVFGLEALFYAYVHVRFSDLYATLIGSPLIGVVVMVFAGADATGTLPNAGERWSRIIERAWAVVVIDAGMSYGWFKAEVLMESDTSDFLKMTAGLLILILAGMLVYAEPYVCLEERASTFTVIPLALLRSLMLAWVNMSRIFSLLALQLALSIVALMIHSTWLELAFVALITAPLAVVFTVAYLDTVSQERSATR